MLANSMADSSNIWQWCNARKKKCRHGPSSPSPRGSKQEKEEEEIQAQRYDIFSCDDDPLLYSSCSDSMNESKVLDGQCCFAKQPTTPDLDHTDHKTQKLDSIAAASPSSSSFSAVVCGQISADSSSSSSSVMHDESGEDGMDLQAMGRSSPPGSKDLSPKNENLDLGLQSKGLSTKSEMPFARNLRPLASRKPKSNIPFSSEGLDLLVKAICMLENTFLVWGNKELDMGRRPPFFHSAMQKKRVIRRARSAYQHRFKSKGEFQLPMVLNSRPDHVSLLDAVDKQSQAKQDDVESQDQDQTPESHLASNLRRSVRSLRGSRATSLAYAGKMDIRT